MVGSLTGRAPRWRPIAAGVDEENGNSVTYRCPIGEAVRQFGGAIYVIVILACVWRSLCHLNKQLEDNKEGSSCSPTGNHQTVGDLDAKVACSSG